MVLDLCELLVQYITHQRQGAIDKQDVRSFTIRNAQNKFSEQPLSGFWGDGRKDKQSPCGRKTATGGIRHHHQRSLRRQIWQQ